MILGRIGRDGAKAGLLDMTNHDAAQLFVHLREGRSAEAEHLARQLLTAGLNSDMVQFALGVALYQRKDFEGAIAALRTSIAIKPTVPAWNNLGAAYRAIGKLVEASAAYQCALAIDPTFADAAANYANVLVDLGSYPAAESMARQAIAAGANSHYVYVTLGNAQFRQGDLLAAAGSYQTALQLAFNISAMRNLGSTLANLGRFEAAKQVYAAALARDPQPELHSSLLICLNYDPAMSAGALRDAYAAFEKAHAAPLTPLGVSHSNSPLPDRRLRIGYVSPDLCNHVVAVFMLPVLARHDRSLFDVTCFADVRHVDETSRKFQSIANWIQITGLSDEEAARRIREQEIDILIDLAGHSPGNRQIAFAHKPAPVQLSYVIGTGTTTGLTAMDGLIADDVLLPGGVEDLISEHPLRLARPFVAYEPPAAMPAVGPLPASRNGFVTFGYFGRPIRLNDSVVRVWSEILKAVPQSRLWLDNKPFGATSTQEDVRRRFAEHGIAPERLLLRATESHPAVLAAYNEIDIALDPFPHNAGTTTLEALWMGVPVLTLTDRPPVGRLGASLLGAVDLRGWIATSEQEYVAKAASAARDLAGLAELRAGLRARCDQSALRDVEDLTRGLERLYRTAWQVWCGGQQALSNA
jgi:protein O-GlcNAc transferase